MDEFDESIDKAAQDLYAVYWGVITPGLVQDWDSVPSNQKQAWREVAKTMGRALSSFILTCGYKLKEPDHR